MIGAITFGQGTKRTRGWRESYDGIEGLKKLLIEREPGDETWWSGHLWANDDRAKLPDTRMCAWEGSSVVVIDCDHAGDAHKASARHVAPTEDRLNALRAGSWPCSLWHETPRGARFVFCLDSEVRDPALIERAYAGASVVVNDALEAAGILAAHDLRGKSIGGYHTDEQTFDLARLMYAPNSVVRGATRASEVRSGARASEWAVEELASAGGRRGASGGTDVARALARLPAEGENDGSSELISCAAKAVRLGVETVDRFLAEASEWNRKRKEPWSREDMATRFEDARARFLEDGVILVPHDEKGKPLYSRTILHKILREDRVYAGRVRLNELTMYAERGERILDDDGITEIEIDICERYRFGHVPREHVERSVALIARERAYNPVQEYLAGLEWDGVDRIEELATGVLGVESDIARVYLRRWMVAAVARAIEPGCKVDTVLALVGDQGIRKSTFFRILAGREFFSDTHLELENKDSYLQIAGTWIYEYAEFEGIYRKSEHTRIRNFLTSSHDKFRAPYDRVTKSWPRRGVLVATANGRDILRDPDGDRRFWVLEVPGMINCERLVGIRDQLWAQALTLYAMGEQWYLTREEDLEREKANAEFRPERADLMILEGGIARLEKSTDFAGHLTVASICTKLGYVMPSAQLQNDIRTVLKARGYKSESRWIEKKTQKVWVTNHAVRAVRDESVVRS